MASKPREHRRPRPDRYPMARVTLSQIVGLVDAIDQAGGEATAAAVAQDIEEDATLLAAIVSAGELLGLLTVDEGRLRLAPLAAKILEANVRTRKKIFREILVNLPMFGQILVALHEAGRPLTRGELVGKIAAQAGTHRAEELFDALVYWGRYAELLRYDGNSELLTLREPATA